MKGETRFPWHRARRATPEETEEARKAIEAYTGKPRARRLPRGRPPKPEGEGTVPVSLRVPERVLVWARREGEKQGRGYQTIINDALRRAAGIAVSR